MKIILKIVVFFILVVTMWSCGKQDKATYYYPDSFYRAIELKPTNDEFKPFVAENKRDSQNVTIGWHPYYLENSISSYDLGLLKTIIFKGYQWNKDTSEQVRNDKIIRAWYETELVEQAHFYGSKVLFSASNYGALRSKQFFDSTALQQDFTDEILAYLKMKDADGVELDFPAVLTNNRDDFTSFIKSFSIRLKQYKPDAELYVSLPFMDKNNAFDIKAIQPYVNLFIISGNNDANLDYSQLDNEPIAPVQNPYNDESSLATAYKHYTGKGINPYQTVLELPNFTTIKRKDKKTGEDYNEFLTYQQFQERYAGNDVFYDKRAMSSFIMLPNPAGSGDFRVYFDDSTSLGAKYDWALGNGFRGVGIWMLGFDNGYHELWRMLDNRANRVPSSSISSSPFAVDSYFSRNYDLFRVWFTIIIILIFLPAVIGMLHWKSRDVLTSLRTAKVYYLIIGGFVFFALLNAFGLLMLSPFLIVIFGIIVGALLTYFINLYLNKRIRKEP